ncbi:MAG: tetratricopeptide repeat protein [Acidobacteriaceae bacterium]
MGEKRRGASLSVVGNAVFSRSWLCFGLGLGLLAASAASLSLHSQKTPYRRQSDGTDGYVEPGTCAECHQAIAGSYRHTGMARSIYKPDPANMTEDFENRNTVFHQASGDYYTIIHHDNEYFQRRHQIGFDGKESNVVEKRIDYVIGSGDQARSYLHRTPEGKLVELPITWYSEQGGYWAMTPGYDGTEQKDFHGIVSQACIFCHDAYPSAQSSEIQESGEPIFPKNLPVGIDCQRCHGPGSAHESAARAKIPDEGIIRRSIVNPARLDRERQMEVCMECHLSTSGSQDENISLRFNRGVFSYRPGTPLADYKLYFDFAGGPDKGRFEIADAAYRLRMSNCFAKSQMTCLTCHDPHVESHEEKTERKYVQVCENCHKDVKHDVALPEAETCVSCHMPKRRGEYAIHTVLTDHYIQRNKPSGDLLAQVTQAKEQDHRNEELAPYYPEKLSDIGEDRLYLAIAETESGRNPQAAADHLKAAVAEQRPEEAKFYAAVGSAYAKCGKYVESAAWFDQALKRKPQDRSMVEQMVDVLLASGQLRRAENVLETVVDTTPLDTGLLANLGNIYARQGKIEKAQETLHKALTVDPDLAQAYNLLGQVEERKDDAVEAERLYREAVRYRPDLAEARNNLANVLVAAERYDEAEFEFRQAIAAAPDSAEARHSHGLFLVITKSYSDAEAELRTAVELDPGAAMFHSDLADVLMQKGDDAEAKAQYQAALKSRPDLDTANLGLGLLEARTGDRASSRSHCQVALKSSDSEIREQARQCLQQ